MSVRRGKNKTKGAIGREGVGTGGRRIERPEHRDWDEISQKVWTAKGLKRSKRIEAWAHGFSDGIRGLVKIDEEGVVSGPYSTQMVEQANQSLNTEWKMCGRDMELFVPYLNYQQERFDGLARERELEILAGRQAALAARNELRDGDAGAGDAVVEKRRNRRASKATQPHDQKRRTIDRQMEEIREEASEPLNDYYARERITIRNEECIRCESAQRFAVYARAACGLFSRVENKKEVRSVASLPLTDLPKLEHMNNYPRYSLALQTEQPAQA